MTHRPPTLCLSMIVRNEAANLRAWLPDARAYVDEIVVVDTGSTDGTLDLLHAAGARVFEQPWADDFALHRNFGLDQVRSDWILILDADERLDDTSWAVLAGLRAADEVLAYRFTVKNYHGTGPAASFDVIESFRLFRNGRGIRYEGAVHNQLGASVERAGRASGLLTRPAAVTVHHYGYALPPEAMQAKRARVYRMVRRTLANDPGDPYYLYQYLAICLGLQRYDEATEVVRCLRFDALRDDLRIQAHQKAAQVALHFDDHDAALHHLQAARRIAPESSFTHYLLSNVLYQARDFDEGLRHAQRALEALRRPSPLNAEIRLAPAELLCNVGMGYLLRGDTTTARAHFEKTLELDPDHADARRWVTLLA